MKVHSHLVSTYRFASDFNIVSMGTLTLMHRMGLNLFSAFAF